MEQNKSQYPTICNISRLLSLANQQQLIEIFDQIKQIFQRPLQQKEDTYKTVASSQGQFDDFIVSATPSLLRCHCHFSLRVQKKSMDALVYLITACFDRFKVIVDNTDIFDALIIGLYRHWKKFTNQSMQSKVVYLIEALIAEVKNLSETIGYSISKERLQNYKFIMQENQLENEIINEGKEKSEPLLVLAAVVMGLKKETTFEAQIKSFIEHYSLQVLDIALKVTHSPDYDQDVIFELKRLLSKLLPQFQWIYSVKQQEEDQNDYKIVHSQSQRDTLEKYCLKLYQCYASIFNAIVLSTQKSFAPDSQEFLTSFNYCLVMLSRFYQILSKRQALQNVIVTVMESLTNGQNPKFYKNAAIFLSYWKKHGSQGFKKKLNENDKLKMIESSEFYDNDFYLADLEDNFQIPYELQVNIINLNNRFFAMNDAISLNKCGFPIKMKLLAGEEYRQIFEIKNPTDLIYVEFTMKQRDIGFSIEKINKFQINQDGEYQEINNELIFFIQKTEGMKRIFNVKGPGIYKIKWDNSYSWVRSKTMQYRIDILSQGESFQFAPPRQLPRTIKQFYQKYEDFKGPSASRKCSQDNLNNNNQDEKEQFIIKPKIEAQDFDLDYVYDQGLCCKVDVKFNKQASTHHKDTSFSDPKSLVFEYSKKILQNNVQAEENEKRMHFIMLKKVQGQKEQQLPDLIQYISVNGEFKTILNSNAFVWNGVNVGREEGLMQYIRFLTGEQFNKEDVHYLSITDEMLVKRAVISVLNSK